MRLWHYVLLPVLPDKMLVAQRQEIVAIKRQWEKGTLKHRLVSYVKEYDKAYFLSYTVRVACEMVIRNINYSDKLYFEIVDFCENDTKKSLYNFYDYPEHDKIYLRECLYNLEEKARRGIISKDEWKKIYDKFSNEFDLWKVE